MTETSAFDLLVAAFHEADGPSCDHIDIEWDCIFLARLLSNTESGAHLLALARVASGEDRLAASEMPS